MDWITADEAILYVTVFLISLYINIGILTFYSIIKNAFIRRKYGTTGKNGQVVYI